MRFYVDIFIHSHRQYYKINHFRKTVKKQTMERFSNPEPALFIYFRVGSGNRFVHESLAPRPYGSFQTTPALFRTLPAMAGEVGREGGRKGVGEVGRDSR